MRLPRLTDSGLTGAVQTGLSMEPTISGNV